MITRLYLQRWLDDQRVFVQLSTWESLQVYITKHLIPYFGKYDLKRITPSLCQSYVHDKLINGRSDGSGGLSLTSVRKHISVFKQALDDAVLRGVLSVNPARFVRIPRNKSPITSRTVFLSADEAQKMISAFQGTNLYLAVVLTLYYGLRRSEVLGLKWSAIDFQRDTITICHTVVKNLTIEAKDSTKTLNSKRSFQLLPELKDILLSESGSSSVSPYILHRLDGTPLRPDSLTRGFQRVLKRNDFPHMRFQDLRHSTASILFDRGWSLEDVKSWLGHSDIETTSNIYLHYSRSRKVLMAQGLSGMLI